MRRVLSLLLFCVATASAKQPNIIFLITDDQGYGPIGKHGHPWIETPNLDKLHDTSVRMERFLVAPTCAPTRAALMTGRHPMRNGVTHTILERERMTLDAEILPQTLKKAGYATGMFGKWHLGDEDGYRPEDRGFDETFAHGAGGIGQKYNCSCADAPGNKYFNPAIHHNGKFVKTSGYCTDLFYEAGLGWINKVREEDAPFFAYISTNAPHGPFIAPEENEKRFTDLGFSEKVAGFYGMIENIDENVGLLLDKLEEWSLLEDTIIIFTSDNGMTGNGAGKGLISTDAEGNEYHVYNADMKGLKGSADEGGVRVPFFIRWDGHFPAGESREQVTAHIDLFPTLTEIAGAENPKDQVEGRSFLKLLTKPKAKWPDRFLVTHKGRWKTGADLDGEQWKNFAIRNHQYRYLGNGDDGALYDMNADPGQTTDIAEQHPEVVAEMRKFYDTWWKETVPMMVNEDAPMSPTQPFHERFYAQEKAEGIPAWETPKF